MLDMTDISGACHCGAVRFRVKLLDGLRTARRCTCSYCRMRGAVVVSAIRGDLLVEVGEEILTQYRFGTLTARHFFCSRCGIYTHHERRSDPSQLGVNVACLDGVSPFDFACVPVNDGVGHPSDTGVARVEGLLRFERLARAEGEGNPGPLRATLVRTGKSPADMG